MPSCRIKMIENCSLKRMVAVILALIGASLLVLGLESVLSPWAASTSPKKNQENTTVGKGGCWLYENFEITESCKPCSQFEIGMKHPACTASGYKEIVHCDKFGEVIRSCDRIPWLEKRNFWVFETSVFTVGFLSSIVLYVRQRQLNRWMFERIQKQIASGD